MNDHDSDRSRQRASLAWCQRREYTRSRPPDYLMAERARRQSIQRTLTAELMGDPHPGYSALDQWNTEHQLGAEAMTMLGRPLGQAHESEAIPAHGIRRLSNSGSPILYVDHVRQMGG